MASEAMDCLVTEVRLEDVLRADDPVITATVEAVAAEAQARARALGGPLYVEALAQGLIVHLLRRYASVETRAPQGAGGLGPGQRRRIADHIESRLGEPLTLAGMAAELGLGACLFARLFRRSFGMPPYAYVLGLKVRGRFCRSSSNRAL